MLDGWHWKPVARGVLLSHRLLSLFSTGCPVLTAGPTMAPILTHARSVALPKESRQQRRTQPSVQNPARHLPLQITVVNSVSTSLRRFFAGIVFQAMEDPRQSDALVQLMSNTGAGQPINFTISGTGILSEPGDDSLGVPHPVRDETVSPPARDSSPGKSAAVPAHPAETYR